jgi:hypothetical protein
MRIFLIITFLLFAQLAINSQSPDKSEQIGQLQAAVGALVSKQRSAAVLLNDFNVVEGKVVALSGDSFSMKIKRIGGGGAGNSKATIRIFFTDVLAISSKTVSVSVIPDQNSRSYGSWDDVLALNYNHALEVVMENGETTTGRLSEKTKDRIILIGETPDQKFSVPREKIVSLYKVRDAYRQSGGKSIQKAAGGAKKGSEIGNIIGITPDGKAFSSALGAGIGALIGTLTGAVAGAKETPRMRLLIYSK